MLYGRWMRMVFTVVIAQIYYQSSYGQDSTLRELTPRERIEYARRNIYPTKSTIYKDSAGNILRGFNIRNPVIQHEIYAGNDFYVNSAGKIAEVIVRKATPDDLALHKKLFDIEEDQLGGSSEEVTIDCQNQRDVLFDVLTKDHENHAPGRRPEVGIDRQNETIVVGVLEKCGPPTREMTGDSAIKAVFLVILHGTRKYQEKYFPLIKSYTEKGRLKRKDLAVLEDKLLKSNALKQKYGTQVSYFAKTGYELYPIGDPDHVDARRAEVGLPPLEDYLKSIEETYQIEIKR